MAALTGCIPDSGDVKIEDKFKELTEIGMYNESSSLYLYDENEAQYAVSTRYNTTRIQNDDKSKYIRIVMGEAPEAGNTITATVTHYGVSNGEITDKSLKAIKIADGKVWLMDEAAKVCYIMPWE